MLSHECRILRHNCIVKLLGGHLRMHGQRYVARFASLDRVPTLSALQSATSSLATVKSNCQDVSCQYALTKAITGHGRRHFVVAIVPG